MGKYKIKNFTDFDSLSLNRHLDNWITKNDVHIISINIWFDDNYSRNCAKIIYTENTYF